MMKDRSSKGFLYISFVILNMYCQIYIYEYKLFCHVRAVLSKAFKKARQVKFFLESDTLELVISKSHWLKKENNKLLKSS